jgi:UDP-N-acetylglucosamine--N-acetylmuramyl-(pentapeptide) pyrophosphoryl-undecaprenol N-acetylglucosamine transferase
MKVVITGGHHSSALPVIKKLREKWPDIQIYWFGHKYSALGDKNPTLEFHEIKALNVPFYHIHAGKFYRTVNLRRLIKIPFGLFQCLYLLIKLKPDAILSFGGYIAVPTAVAGWLLGIPSITHEQTVVAGWANRLVSKFAKKVLVSWPQSQKFFPREKTIFVGLPLRHEIFEIKSQNFVIDNDLPTVYITTGKIGSHVINKVVGECLSDLLKFSNVIHQCGDNSVCNDFSSLTDIKGNIGTTRGKYYLKKFIFENEIGEAFSKSDLVVSRSGAHTTAELLALKKTCLLIPISWVSHNEQYENAKILVEAGLGTILPENKLSKESLLESVQKGFDRKVLRPVPQDGIGRSDESAELIVQHLVSIIKKIQ